MLFRSLSLKLKIKALRLQTQQGQQTPPPRTVSIPIYLQNPRHMLPLKAGWLGPDLGGWWLGGSQSRTMVDNCCLIMISGGWWLQGHNQVELAIEDLIFIFYYYFFFII